MRIWLSALTLAGAFNASLLAQPLVWRKAERPAEPQPTVRASSGTSGGVALDRSTAHVSRHVEDARVAAVGMQVAGEHPGRVGCLENHRARAIAEKHAGGTVAPVEDA